jgi:23S rRNA pseudouridine1911/1915/1917 synthase
MSELRVLFEDNHCLAVDKPAGLLTQGVPGIPTMEQSVREYIKTTYAKAGNVYLGVPHRLDRPVSGVMLFAKTSKAAQRFSQQFRERQVHKVYWGLVEGTLSEPHGRWRDSLRKIPDEARAVKADPDEEGAREASLSYRALTTIDGGSLVEFTLESGRMHQIRLQSSLRGHPLWGDELYGSTRSFGPAAELPRDRVIALHARSLTFLHPIRFEPVRVEAPLPKSWRDAGVEA